MLSGSFVRTYRIEMIVIEAAIYAPQVCLDLVDFDVRVILQIQPLAVPPVRASGESVRALHSSELPRDRLSISANTHAFERRRQQTRGQDSRK